MNKKQIVAVGAAIVFATVLWNAHKSPNKTIQTQSAKESIAESKVPWEYTAALKRANQYSEQLYMSKNKIYEQLTSEYGGKFSHEAAQYAIENIKADWNYNALKKAEVYRDKLGFSPKAIYDQLIHKNGSYFTSEQAQYAIDNLK